MMNSPDNSIGRIHAAQGGGFEGHLQRFYEGHAPAEVWRMLTDKALMGQWLAPGTIELRTGGAVRIDFEDSGTVIRSTVLAIDEGRLLAYSWSSGDEPRRPLRWELEGGDQGTTLRLTVGIPAAEDAAKACAGFEGHLEMLGAALEGVPMKFPFDLFLKARTQYREQLGK